MEEKTKNTKEIYENIKAELNALHNLNKKWKSVLDKLSKSILAKEKETENNKYNLSN